MMCEGVFCGLINPSPPPFPAFSSLGEGGSHKGRGSNNRVTDNLNHNAHGRCKGVGEAKMAGIELACRLSGMSQRKIGEHYVGMSSQAVSKSRKRAKIMISPDPLTRLANIARECSHVSS